ncbi:40S ribosomal protein S19 [Candidatus Pacearchaeota archaeon]|nr:40S ribosomal protein S19 [Candidatus Pacearchaeota archaeon]
MATNIFSKNPQAFNIALAEALKQIPEIQAPEWSFFVKTGISKQRVPEAADFWHTRTASILRQLYIQGVVGVQRLRTRYGGRKNRGVRPARFKKSSGKMLRVMLQQSEKAGFVEKITGSQFGRRLTKKGRDFLDAIVVPEVQSIALGEYIGKEKIVEKEMEIPEFKEESNDSFRGQRW